MFCGWRWYARRLSDLASSRQTSSVSSLEALSETTSSRCAWSWASTERTTSATRFPALRTGRPIDTSTSELRIRTPFVDGTPAWRAEIDAAQQGEERHGNSGATG